MVQTPISRELFCAGLEVDWEGRRALSGRGSPDSWGPENPVIICRSHLTSQILASARSESFLAVLEGCHF